MSVLNENTLLGASGAGGDYEIEQSLRFDKGSTPYLNRTFAAVGNRKTWTFSAWIKRAGLTDGTKTIFSSYAANNDAGYFDISFLAADTIGVHTWGTTFRVSNQLFRDTSAWYHVVLAVDTTQGTASNRLKVYVNGDEITSWSTNNAPSQNFDTAINNDKIHSVGALSSTAAFVDGYMGEVNFIDGQALTPDSLGETGKYGEWNPIKYAGTYGTNGFYLPFKQDYSVEGFSTVVYEANTQVRYVGGTGFKPDFIWFKNRTRSSPHRLVDAVRGLPNMLMTNTSGVEATAAADGTLANTVTGFTADGFTLGIDDGGYRVNSANGDNIVAWSWDMGSTTASNTDGTITTSVRANTTYGQSIVSYTGNATNNTKLGHGLGSTPEIVIVKSRTTAAPWKVGGSVIQAVFGDGSNNSAFLSLNTNAGADQHTTGFQGNTATTIGVGADSDTNSNGATYIAYAFHSVTGYSKCGSYSGNGSTTGPTLALGFSPAFVIIKSMGVEHWKMYDNVRNPFNPVNTIVNANEADAEATSGNNTLNFTATGFQCTSTSGATNASGGKYIYMAFADTREYAYWLDQSGNNNDWESEGGLTESDVMVDSPTNNFSTWNPLFRGGESSSSIYASTTLSEGNLQASVPTNSYMGNTMRPQSGTWYSEFLVSTVTNEVGWGWINAPKYSSSTANAGIANKWGGYYHGYAPADLRVYDETSQLGSNIALTISNGDILQLAWDIDNNKGWIGVNNTWYAADNGTDGNPSAGTNQTFTFAGTEAANLQPYVANGTGTAVFVANFGSDSSFAGTKTPQGKQDGNGIGDFYYQPPSGFLSLCTANLPSVDVIPSENFNPVIYSGTGADNRVLSGVGFTPDLGIFKRRNGSGPSQFFDTLRGNSLQLRSDSTSAESTQSNKQKTFTSDGYTLGTDAQINGSGGTYVAWNWKAGGSASSNSNGTITSQVSANVDAGFSIVSYTGTGAIAATIGHGLASAPTMIIRKDRDTAVNWVVYHASMGTGNGNLALFLNTSSAQDGGQGFMNNTAPTASVFTQGDQGFVGVSGRDYISYCFHDVDGYSKIGKYVGNGNANGPFVHCGFRPAFVIFKKTNAARSWPIQDSKRIGYNPANAALFADLSEAEYAVAAREIDITSNGFKIRTTAASHNTSNDNYIFMAFAESPFKHSNAR